MTPPATSAVGAWPPATEAELVAEFLKRLAGRNGNSHWTVYPETAGWDLLLVHKNGYQLGLEAKLSLNAKVIDQALDGWRGRNGIDGPDYRGVLVPAEKCQHHLRRICEVVGIGIVALYEQKPGYSHGINLPNDVSWDSWPNWGPVKRCPVPDYIPDVVAGVASPVQLTDWKVRAIKLSIVLERKGWVDRGDMRALGISPSRWTDRYNGFLAMQQVGQYVRCEATPDYRKHHPTNYAQIEADAEIWGRELDPFKQTAPAYLAPTESPAR